MIASVLIKLDAIEVPIEDDGTLGFEDAFGYDFRVETLDQATKIIEDRLLSFYAGDKDIKFDPNNNSLTITIPGQLNDRLSEDIESAFSEESDLDWLDKEENLTDNSKLSLILYDVLVVRTRIRGPQ
jgi:hypothetical protein